MLGWEDLQAELDAPLEDRLCVTPMLDRSTQVGSASIDLRLDTRFVLFRRSLHGGIDPLEGERQAVDAAESTRERVTVPFGDGLWLHPQEMVLGATLEFIRLPKTLAAFVQSRSTWGRLGLMVAMADMVHPGFAGSLTLELFNTSNTPLKLYPGLRIAQLAVHRLEQPTAYGYDATPSPQYLTSTGVVEAKQAWTENEVHQVEQLGKQLRDGGAKAA